MRSFILSLGAVMLGASFAPTRAAPEELCGRPFVSVDQLYAELQHDPSIKPGTSTDKFVALIDDGGKRIWNLVRAPHPAAPALVCRSLVHDHGNIVVNTTAQCFGPDQACRALMDEYRELDAKARQLLQAKSAPR
jgi:hypothetical protein